MALAIRLSRGGAKKRPYYRIVVADNRSPRDGKWLERIGSYNPLLPKDSPERVKLDKDRAEYWLGVGAQPSDRVARFLDAEGLYQRQARNNPQKAQPGEKARERAEEKAAKAAEAAETPAEDAPAEEVEETAAEETPAQEAAPETASEEAAETEAKTEETPSETAPAAATGEDAPAEDSKAGDAQAEDAKTGEKADAEPAKEDKPAKKAKPAKTAESTETPAEGGVEAAPEDGAEKAGGKAKKKPEDTAE